MNRIFYAKSQEQISDLKYEQYLSLIPENMKARITRYLHWQDCQISLFSRLLLIEGIKSFGMNESILKELQFEKYRRPFLNNKIDFNISHSNQWAVCVISDSNRVGIDIEQIKQVPLDDFNDTLTTDELKALNLSKDKYKFFYHIWSKKEASSKADGRGLIQPFNEIELKDDTASFNGKVWQIKPLEIDSNYASYVATDITNKGCWEIKQIHF
jgi:4'-phosphopantetheinyl transferase